MSRIPAALLIAVVVGTLPACSELSAAPAAPSADEPATAIATCPWSDLLVDTTATADDDPVAVTEALALPDDLFWPLIEGIPDDPKEADFDAVSSALAGCDPDDLIAFEARLHLALYALDGPSNADWIAENDPSGLGFVSDDSFLYYRCATVLAGREAWSRAVADGTLEWGDDTPDTTGQSESLLAVGMVAARAQGRSMDDYYGDLFRTIPISYESGSNTALWGG